VETDRDIAWAAGLFEGEGCATHSSGRPRLQLKMVQEESVRRFGRVVGVGRVGGPYGPYDPTRQPFFMWYADGDAGRVVVDLLAPYLSAWCLERIEIRYPKEVE
jgi:hypothetical protein